jgi:integrase
VSRVIQAELLERFHDLNLSKELIRAAKDPKERAIASILGECFVPTTVLTLITRGDIDFQKEALAIINLRGHVSKVCLCGERLFKRHRFCPACGSKVPEALQDKLEKRNKRIIPVSHDTLDLIEKYLEWRRYFPNQGPRLFPVSRQRIWQIIERLGRKVGVKGLHPSSLHHLLAARWVNKGLDPRILKFLMGYAGTKAHPPLFSFDQVKA